MEDLIKRKDAMDAVDRVNRAHMRLKGRPMVGWGTLLIEIESLPSVEPKTGWWIPVDSFSAYGGDEATWGAHGNPIAFYYCSECKEHAYAGETGESLLTDFCPHCGARMEGGKE